HATLLAGISMAVWATNLWTAPDHTRVVHYLWLCWGCASLAHLVVLQQRLWQAILALAGWAASMLALLMARFGPGLDLAALHPVVSIDVGEGLVSLMVFHSARRISNVAAMERHQARALRREADRLQAMTHLDDHWSRRVTGAPRAAGDVERRRGPDDGGGAGPEPLAADAVGTDLRRRVDTGRAGAGGCRRGLRPDHRAAACGSPGTRPGHQRLVEGLDRTDPAGPTARRTRPRFLAETTLRTPVTNFIEPVGAIRFARAREDHMNTSQPSPSPHEPQHAAEDDQPAPIHERIEASPGITHAAAPSDAPHEPTHAAEPDLLLSAREFRMRGRESMVFGPLDLDFPSDRPAVLVGQQGSGRSSLLLALAGRLKGVEGSLQVGEIDGIAQPWKLRQQVSVARISGFAELEDNLTIGESRDERAIAEGIGTRRGRTRFRELEDLLGHRFDTDQLVDRMAAQERMLLTLVLGCLSPARFVVADDVDESLTDDQLVWLHDAMALLTEDGNRFVISSLEQSPLPPLAAVVTLPPPAQRGEPNFALRRTRRRSTTIEDA
ncbi:ATP-binding cassette domain-containing protein, partial [Luteococcus sp.]|uniref:ATP-binding cassette domain-containing protein n=1 Tax=Luteococcus sp. TaxID=1969402 RepID=UPI003735F5F2